MHKLGKILVVEDNPGLREQVARILEMENYSVLTAIDGEQGLQLVGDAGPDLVLCDIMMPRMDGHQLLQAMRATESGSATPFVFLTAKADRSDIRTGMALGADDYLTKPFGADELIAAVKLRLSKHRLLARRRTDLMRNESLVTLSHEVRTPLNGIIGVSDLLLEQPSTIAPAEREDLLRDLRTSSQRLGHSLSNLMLHLEVESTRQSGERDHLFNRGGPVAVATAVRTAVERESRKWRRNAVLVLPDDLVLTCMPAPFLEKTLEEIIDNAFKFSPSDAAISVSAANEDHGVVVTISDCGYGMTLEQINTHQAFRQYRRPDRGVPEGLGLGVAIARRLLEFNAGSLKISSLPGTGTTVTVRLARGTARSHSDAGARSDRNNPSR